ncbi:hypothetical protein STEG23_015997, partial [Scotinomys teguina]
MKHICLVSAAAALRIGFVFKEANRLEEKMLVCLTLMMPTNNDGGKCTTALFVILKTLAEIAFLCVALGPLPGIHSVDKTGPELTENHLYCLPSTGIK